MNNYATHIPPFSAILIEKEYKPHFTKYTSYFCNGNLKHVNFIKSENVKKQILDGAKTQTQ